MAGNVLVDAVAVLSKRDAHHQWAVKKAPDRLPPWSTSEAVLSGSRAEAHGEILRPSRESRRCLPRAHDRNACRLRCPDDRRGFPRLPSSQPSDGSVCDPQGPLLPGPAISGSPMRPSAARLDGDELGKCASVEHEQKLAPVRLQTLNQPSRSISCGPPTVTSRSVTKPLARE
jgi:hypothetical protein